MFNVTNQDAIFRVPSQGQAEINPTTMLPWYVSYPSGQTDSFGRPRVSIPTIFFNTDFQYDAAPLWFVQSATGTGSAVKTSGESDVTLSTGGTVSGAGIIFQTKQYFRYEPAKGRFVVMSGLLGPQTLNVRSRFGNFDTNNGDFFELDGTLGASVNQRSNISGSVVDMKVLQADWNIDKMDGSGPSGITLDFSKTLIFWIDYQWLGSGRSRFGFIVNGALQAVHEIYNDNVNTAPYMNSGDLPLRAELFNTGTASASTSIKLIVMCLLNEGSSELSPSYTSFVVDSDSTLKTISATALTPLMSIQPATTFAGLTNRIQILLHHLKVVAVKQNMYWQLIYNGTLTGASFSAVNPNSSVTKDTSATAVSGGIVVASGYAVSGARCAEEELDTDVLPFTLDYTGTIPDTYTLAVQGLAGGGSAGGKIRWLELK